MTRKQLETLRLGMTYAELLALGLKPKSQDPDLEDWTLPPPTFVLLSFTVEALIRYRPLDGGTQVRLEFCELGRPLRCRHVLLSLEEG